LRLRGQLIDIDFDHGLSGLIADPYSSAYRARDFHEIALVQVTDSDGRRCNLRGNAEVPSRDIWLRSVGSCRRKCNYSACAKKASRLDISRLAKNGETTSDGPSSPRNGAA
jgi:hypothetical protein